MLTRLGLPRRRQQLLSLLPIPLVYFLLIEAQLGGKLFELGLRPDLILLEFALENASLSLIHSRHDALAVWEQLVVLGVPIGAGDLRRHRLNARYTQFHHFLSFGERLFISITT